MNKRNPISEDVYPLQDLCVLVDMTPRNVRYYVQIGLVDRPVGETRAARYGPKQLEQLLLIKKWTAGGVSLERIRELLQGEDAPIPARPSQPGSIEVCSHLKVADGIEVVIEPGRAGLSPDQVRKFVKSVMAAYEQATQVGIAAEPTETEFQQTENTKGAEK